MRINDALQWAGAVFIIAAHVLNALGSEYHQDLWNQAAFWLGTICFFAWSLRVANRPQTVVNVVGITAITLGLFKALG